MNGFVCVPYCCKNYELTLAEILKVLRNPDECKVSTFSANQPRGGELYVYQLNDSFSKDAFASDGYRWFHMGWDNLPHKDPVVRKVRFHTRTQIGTSTKFRRLIYYLMSDVVTLPQYVVAHYIGDESISVAVQSNSSRSLSAFSLLGTLSSMLMDFDEVSVPNGRTTFGEAMALNGLGSGALSSDRLQVSVPSQTRRIGAHRRTVQASILRRARIHLLKSSRMNACRQSSMAKKSKMEEYSDDPDGLQYPCPFCKKSYDQFPRLNEHVKIHTTQPTYICRLCDKRFYYRSGLRVHARSHLNIKPFLCSYCDHQCSTAHNLRVHERKHTGEKPYVCTECFKRFSQRWNLHEHQRRHTGERPHVCDVCSASFSRLSAMRRHRKLHSEERVTYPCADCGLQFYSKTSVYRHSLLHSQVASESATRVAEQAAKAVFQNLDNNIYNKAPDDGRMGTVQMKKKRGRPKGSKNRCSHKNQLELSSTKLTEKRNVNLAENLMPSAGKKSRRKSVGTVTELGKSERKERKRVKRRKSDETECLQKEQSVPRGPRRKKLHNLCQANGTESTNEDLISDNHVVSSSDSLEEHLIDDIKLESSSDSVVSQIPTADEISSVLPVEETRSKIDNGNKSKSSAAASSDSVSRTLPGDVSRNEVEGVCDRQQPSTNVDVISAQTVCDELVEKFTCGLCEAVFSSLEDSVVCFYSH